MSYINQTYIHRVCREHYTVQMEVEFTEHYNGNREGLEVIDAVTGLGLF